MASAVDICNLALAHLGDDATVASIDPPEGSAQAQHCARFYPIARNALLEMHDWGFATKRATPALIESTITQWQYSCSMPADAIRVFAVLPPGSIDDYSAPALAAPYRSADGSIYSPMPVPASYQTQPFAVEALANGTVVVYTNQEEAEIRYLARITDTNKFSPLFVTTLGWLLASYLAGPLLKGDVGQAEGKRCQQMFAQWLAMARSSDAQQQHQNIQHSVSWMVVR